MSQSRTASGTTPHMVFNYASIPLFCLVFTISFVLGLGLAVDSPRISWNFLNYDSFNTSPNVPLSARLARVNTSPSLVEDNNGDNDGDNNGNSNGNNDGDNSDVDDNSTSSHISRDSSLSFLDEPVFEASAGVSSTSAAAVMIPPIAMPPAVSPAVSPALSPAFPSGSFSGLSTIIPPFTMPAMSEFMPMPRPPMPRPPMPRPAAMLRVAVCWGCNRVPNSGSLSALSFPHVDGSSDNTRRESSCVETGSIPNMLPVVHALSGEKIPGLNIIMSDEHPSTSLSEVAEADHKIPVTITIKELRERVGGRFGVPAAMVSLLFNDTPISLEYDLRQTTLEELRAEMKMTSDSTESDNADNDTIRIFIFRPPDLSAEDSRQGIEDSVELLDRLMFVIGAFRRYNLNKDASNLENRFLPGANIGRGLVLGRIWQHLNTIASKLNDAYASDVPAFYLSTEPEVQNTIQTSFRILDERCFSNLNVYGFVESGIRLGKTDEDECLEVKLAQEIYSLLKKLLNQIGGQ